MVYNAQTMNAEPYYDDFDETKKFLRLMFRPGYAVQARELTQLQTIIQNQLGKFGSHVFQDGSKVVGSDVFDSRLPYFRVIATSVTGSVDVTDFEGLTFSLTGQSSVTGSPVFQVVHIAEKESDYDPYHVIFYRSLNGSTGFTFGNTIVNNVNGYSATIPGATGTSADVFGNGIVVSVDSGFRFVDGFFTYHESQKIAPYSLTGATLRNFDTPTVRVGFDMDKKFVNHTDDTTLDDPAYGSYNYGAPGSDRYVIDLNIGFHELALEEVSATANFARTDFIEFYRLALGETIKQEKYPEYSIIDQTLARRTFDESGNYTVRPFGLRIETDDGLSDHQLRGIVDPGKAYIFGYEFETQAPSEIVIDRARPEDPNASSDESIRSITTLEDVTTTIGNYLIGYMAAATGNFGSPLAFDLSAHPRVYLSGGTGGSAYAGFGSARVRDIRSNGGTAYRIYLEEIALDGATAFSATRRLFRPGVTGATQALFLVTDPTLYSPSRDTLLFRVPKGDVIKEITETLYGIRKVANVTFSSGVAVLSKSDFGTDVNNSKVDFSGADTVLVATPGENVIVYTENGVTLTGNAGPTTSSSQLRIELSDTTYNGSAYVVASLDIQDSGSPLDTYTVKSLSAATASITGGLQTDSNNFRFVYLNGYVDVNEVLSISGSTGGSNVDLTNFFDLDTGQTDNLYDWSRIVLKNQYRNEGVTGPFTVAFNYFSRVSGRGPFYVNSYDGITFGDIPTYTSVRTGEVFDLANTIDFRPDRTGTGVTGGTLKSNANVTERYFPHPLKSYDVNFDYYLPRTDKVVLTRDRNFEVIKGRYDDSAPVPPDREDAMTLYVVRVNPYTYNEKDVNSRYVENKRYTMRDIGKLEKRLEKVEYYSTLSLLEQESTNLTIKDSNGEDRFKNGVLVDSFKGHAVGDVLNQWYACSMDFSRGELRPPFTMKSFNFQVDSSLPSGLTQSSGRLITLNYSTTPVVSQPLASKSISVNPFNVVSWLGSLEISPSSDTWFDTENNPDVLVNLEGENDGWLGIPTARGASAAFGSQWNAWETIWSGENNVGSDAFARGRFRDRVPHSQWDNNRFTDSSLSRDTLALRPGQVRNGIRETQTPETITRSLGSRIVNASIIPFMRSNVLSVSARGLKPNTRMYPFFDNTNVTAYCVPPGGVTGGAIWSDANGSVLGLTFDLPAGTFRTGERLFRLTNEPNNVVQNASASAEQVFGGQGLLLTQERTVVSTRLPTVRREGVNSESIVTDPINRNNQRVTGTTRTTWIDPIAQTILIDGTVYPSGIFVDSVDLFFAAKATTPALPITVQIRPTINGYPHSSQIIPLAEKILNASEVSVSDDASDATRFRFDAPIYLPPGEYAIVVISNSDEYEVYVSELGQNRLGTTERISQQPYSGSLFKSQNASTWTATQLEDLTFVVNRCVFDISASESNRKATFQNAPTTRYNTNLVLPVHLVRVLNETVEPPATSLEYEFDIKNSGEIGSPFPTGNQGRILPNQNILLDSEKAIDPDWASSNDDAIQLKATFTSDSDEISPVVDLDRLSVITVQNFINNNTDMTGANDNGELFADPSGVTAANRALTRYISKQVTLEDGFESDDLHVYVTVAKPAGTSIKVFGKFNTAESSVPFDARPYTEMSLRAGTTDYISTNQDDFVELAYTPGTSGTDATFKTFAIKIVLFSDNPAIVPILRDVRAIALPAPV